MTPTIKPLLWIFAGLAAVVALFWLAANPGDPRSDTLTAAGTAAALVIGFAAYVAWLVRVVRGSREKVRRRVSAPREDRASRGGGPELPLQARVALANALAEFRQTSTLFPLTGRDQDVLHQAISARLAPLWPPAESTGESRSEAGDAAGIARG